MPAKRKGGGQWGITWAEVADSVADHQLHYSCRLEFGVVRTSYGKNGRGECWLVSCRAIAGRDGAYRHEGYAECSVGGASGASSFPGAFVRTIIDSTLDLDKRRRNKAHDRDNPVPPRT
jgi:hypothetical protein